MSLIHQGSTGRSMPQFGGAFKQYQLDHTELIASQVLTEVNSPRESGKLDVLIREDLAIRQERTNRAPGSAYPRGAMRTETIPFNTGDWGFEMPLPHEKRAWYRTSFNAEEVYINKAVEEILGGHEARTSTLVFNDTTWDTGDSDLYTDFSGSAPWDTAGSDVIGSIQATILIIKRNTGMRPNALIATESALVGLVAVNTAIRSLMGSADALPWKERMQRLAGILGVDEIIMASASYNSALEGQTFSGTGFWNENLAMLARVGKTSNPEEPCVGRTIIWDEFGPGFTNVTMYEENQTKSTVFQVDSKHVEIILDKYFAHLMLIDA